MKNALSKDKSFSGRRQKGKHKPSFHPIPAEKSAGIFLDGHFGRRREDMLGCWLYGFLNPFFHGTNQPADCRTRGIKTHRALDERLSVFTGRVYDRSFLMMLVLRGRCAYSDIICGLIFQAHSTT
jgi:hypothetical protein